MDGHILAIDQGTTSSRAIVFDAQLQPVAVAQQEFVQHFPASGWVEHDPADLWASTAGVCRSAIEQAGLKTGAIAAIGLTNQRETTVVWDRRSGEPIHRAIVWQDRRTAETCARLRAEGLEPLIAAKSGLLADPYFSGSKIAWILDHVEGARAAAEAGDLLFGTVDSWLIWKLTDGAVHATDATNASRTMLVDLRSGQWDPELCRILRVPMAMLPEIRDCAGPFGFSRPDLFGRPLPILGVAGDQQAALMGQACFQPGMMKATYGTGCFALLQTGAEPVASANRMLTTIAWQLDGRRAYALEGSIFIAGAVVQWLRDGLEIIREAAETAALAEQASAMEGLYLVPAFTGLGAPWWEPEARGAVLGMTRATGKAELARAALESVGYQTRDLLEAMRRDWRASGAETVLRVDGGMTASAWTMQFLADILGAPVDRPAIAETTALGAAWLAGMAAGLCPDMAGFAQHWARERRFEPAMPPEAREARYAGWLEAVRRVLGPQ